MNKTINNQSKNRSFLFLALISFVVMTISFSCEEDVNSLGSELMPDSDAIEVFYDSSLTFNSFVVQNEAINTSNLSYYSLGIIDDPSFGIFRGEMVSQFTPSIQNIDVEEMFIDSAVLFISIDSIYGESGSISFDLFELSSDLNEDSTYLSSSNISEYFTLDEKLNDTYKLSGDSLIIFKLNDTFTERLTSDNDLYKSNSLFKEEFKGIALVPEIISSKGSAYTLNLTSTNSKIKLFYHTEKNDSLILDYSLSSSAVHKFAQYTYDYNGYQAYDYITNTEDESDGLIFLQGIAGLYSEITFTNIKTWITDTIKYSVLNANLTIPTYSDDNIELYHPPEQLSLYYRDEDTSYYPIEDYYNYIQQYNYSYDGHLNDDEKYYHFDITRHLMAILNGEIKDSSIRINNINRSIYPHRVILKTGEDIKLKITYTKHK
jgi:hypothetical protein